jgi:hypothetical protein
MENENSHPDFCSFFCHHNWRWVVERALEFLKSTNTLKCVTINSCKRTKELPSYILLQKVLKRYSLFRVEVYSQQHLCCAWVRREQANDTYAVTDQNCLACDCLCMCILYVFRQHVLLLSFWMRRMHSIGISLSTRPVKSCRAPN